MWGFHDVYIFAFFIFFSFHLVFILCRVFFSCFRSHSLTRSFCIQCHSIHLFASFSVFQLLTKERADRESERKSETQQGTHIENEFRQKDEKEMREEAQRERKIGDICKISPNPMLKLT